MERINPLMFVKFLRTLNKTTIITKTMIELIPKIQLKKIPKIPKKNYEEAEAFQKVMPSEQQFSLPSESARTRSILNFRNLFHLHHNNSVWHNLFLIRHQFPTCKKNVLPRVHLDHQVNQVNF